MQGLMHLTVNSKVLFFIYFKLFLSLRDVLRVNIYSITKYLLYRKYRNKITENVLK